MRFRLAHSSSFFSLTAAILVLSSDAQAQPPTPQLPSPPPMRFVARDDRSQLSVTKDAKARVRLSLELADTRLDRMEEFTSQKKFERASEALGNYLGLIEDARRFIGGLVQDKNGTRDLYRKLDIALRGHIPRLAVMRRDTPAEFAVHLRAAEEFARNTRAEVLESFYGHTVLREPPQRKADANKTTPQDNKRP